MKHKSYCLVLGCVATVIFASCAGASSDATDEPNDITGRYHLPALADTTNPAFLQADFLYPSDDKPTPQSHASTLVETPDGIVAAYFGGTHEGNADVGIHVSRLVDGQWTRPVEVANGIQNDTLRYPCWNPVLFQPEGGDLMLFYKVGPEPQKWWGMVMTSADNGVSWSTPRLLGEDPAIGRLFGPIKNKPVQLADGTIISPSSIEYPKGGGDDQDWRVYFEISRDMGNTWEVVGPINDGVAFDAIQPSILTYPDGRLQVICRTRQGVLAQSWSDDQGCTWSTMTAMDLPNPNSGTDAVTLQDGRQLLVYNHTSLEGEEPKGRNMLNVAVSDNGTDWTPVMTLENEPIADGYAYPAVIQASDGLVHISYTYNRRAIKHVVIDPEALSLR